MYRKCVRKWRLLKRNRITCPETVVNCQFLPGKSNFFVKLPKNRKFSVICLEKSKFLWSYLKKNRNFSEICPEKSIILWNCLKNRNFSEICLVKSNFFLKLPEKIETFEKFALKNQFFGLWNCLKKSKFFGNFPRKSKFFDPDPRIQISNQIDAAALDGPKMARLKWEGLPTSSQ